MKTMDMMIRLDDLRTMRERENEGMYERREEERVGRVCVVCADDLKCVLHAAHNWCDYAWHAPMI